MLTFARYFEEFEKRIPRAEMLELQVNLVVYVHFFCLLSTTFLYCLCYTVVFKIQAVYVGNCYSNIHVYGTEQTARLKTMDHLSSVSLLMSVESNSGATDARATVTWPSAVVAARLNPSFQTALLCSRASTRESLNWVTASWHRVLQAERSRHRDVVEWLPIDQWW